MKMYRSLAKCKLTTSQGRYFADGFMITKRDYHIARIIRLYKAKASHPDHEHPESALQAT